MKVPFLDLSLQHRESRKPALAALAATYDANRFCLGQDVEDFERNFGAPWGIPAVAGMNSGTAPIHVACMAAGFRPGRRGDRPSASPSSAPPGASSTRGRARCSPTSSREPSTSIPAKIEAADHAEDQGHRGGAPLRAAGPHGRDHGGRPADTGSSSSRTAPRRSAPGTGKRRSASSGTAEPSASIRRRTSAVAARAAPLSRGARRSRRARGRSACTVPTGATTTTSSAEISGWTASRAAVLNVKLPHLAAWNERRRAIAARYLAGIRLADARLPVQPDYGRSVFHQFTILHPRRDALRAHLAGGARSAPT